MSLESMVGMTLFDETRFVQNRTQESSRVEVAMLAYIKEISQFPSQRTELHASVRI